jgi:hypothetical protein
LLRRRAHLHHSTLNKCAEAETATNLQLSLSANSFGLKVAALLLHSKAYNRRRELGTAKIINPELLKAGKLYDEHSEFYSV